MSEGRNPLAFIKYGFYAIIAIFLLTRFFGGGSEGADYVEETLEDPTQGIVAHIQEVEKDLFKITDEKLIDKKEDSQIIATFMDSHVDTFSLEEIKLTEANNPQRSMLRSVAMAGMLGYMMGRPMGSGLSRSAYADDKSFNKSNTSGKNQLRSTASRKVVKTPAKKGYGSSKSTRSYGG